MFSYKLDDITFTDALGGIEDSSRTILREWEGSGSENILRLLSESSLVFTGSAYNYLCAKANDQCAATNVKIYNHNGYLFYEGTVYTYMLTFDIKKKTAETAIKDTSWSSLLRNRQSQEIYIRSTKTIGCEDIEFPLIRFVEFYDINGNPLPERRRGFDALEVLDYLARYLTDNKITVTSQYLTNEQYGIFTGKVIGESVDQAALSFQDRYPVISFDKLYTEIRKKLNLYINVDYSGANPVLVLEPESDSFDTTEVYTISEIQEGTLFKVDEKRLVSIIKNGSSDTEINDEIYRSFPNLRYFNWDEGTWNNCSCESDDANELDLVSDFIISSDVILETLATGGKSETDIFLVRCLFAPLPSLTGIAGQTLNVTTGFYYYNEELRNPNVIDRWIQYSSSCIYSQRQSDLLFRCKCDPLPTPLPPFWPECQSQYAGGLTNRNNKGIVFFQNPATSSLPNVYDTESGWRLNPGGFVFDLLPNYVGYEIQVPTWYLFFARAIYGFDAVAPVELNWVKYSLVVYEDTTLGTELYRKDIERSYFNQQSISDVFEITSDFIYLSFGNCVVIEVNNIQTNPVPVGVISEAWNGDEFMIDNELLSCFDVPIEGERYPYKYEFTMPLCNSDFDILLENKQKAINYAGAKCFIGKITQKLNNQTTFELLSNEIICCNE
jgi:uncharacterized protein with HEPN domain